MKFPMVKRIVAALGFDRDISYALGSRITTAGGQFVTLALVALLMSPAVQGYHFTFLAFTALQHFFELGFYVVLINTAAHEGAHLSLGPDGCLTGPEGPLNRLASLLRLSVRWYGYASAAFIVAVLAAGWWFFSARPQTGIDWQAPWIAFVMAAGLNIWGNSALSFLEGCGQVAESYRIRLFAALMGQGAAIVVLLSGAELWVAVTAIGVTAAAQILLTATHHFTLFQSLSLRAPAEGMSWRADLWPLQWRIALQGIAGGACVATFAPVAFYYHGPIEAGRIGVTWAIASGALSVMISWVQARAPRLAAFAARGDQGNLDAMFHQVQRASFGVFVLALSAAWLGLTGLHIAGIDVAARMLSPQGTAWMFGAVLLFLLSLSMAVYLRAHKVDPSALTNTAASIAGALMIWAAGTRYGTTAMAAGYFVSIALIMLPCQTVIFFHFRRQKYPAVPSAD